MNIKIRLLQKEDLDQVTELENSCFSMPWRRNDFEDILTNPTREYVVAVCEQRVIGGCMLTDILGEGDISNVAVLEEYRRKKIGIRLLEKIFEIGELRGINAYTLEVREHNVAAIKLYEKMGFVSEGIRPNFYEKPKENAVIMWKRL